MATDCTPHQLECRSLGRRDIVARCDGGEISSNGGGLVLREVEQRTHLLHRLSQCFTDYRDVRREGALSLYIQNLRVGCTGTQKVGQHTF